MRIEFTNGIVGAVVLRYFLGEADYKPTLPLDLMTTTAFFSIGAVREGLLLQSM